jgi:hypothetical protein
LAISTFAGRELFFDAFWQDVVIFAKQIVIAGATLH